MAKMAHLHMHSSYSILDAISKIDDIVKRLSELGHTHAALTDHGTIAGVPEFYNACKKAKIKPIPAEEFYMVPDAAASKEAGDRMSHHLILLAMNDEGWKNIKLLNTKANQKFYYSPRIDYNDLKEHGNGLMCLTACLKGIVPYNISIDNFDEAAKHATQLREIFGDRFYLEVQDGGLDIQPKVNAGIRALGKNLGVKVVACQDAHYIDRNDVEAHEAIWAIRTRHTLDTPVGYGQGKEFRPYYSTREYWLKDFEHIMKEPLTTEKGFQRHTDIKQEELEVSMEIAERVGDVKIESRMHLPRYEFVPDIKHGTGCATDKCHSGEFQDLTSFNYLVELVHNGFEKRYGVPFAQATDAQKERINKELVDIKDARLSDYFLIIWDIVSWAKSKGIPLGPGRGSAAGSIVSYCLNITGVDPIKYGLIWERFFNRGRIGSLADIDLDFSMERREEVIDYMKNRFGENRVAQMVTFNTLATKAALKDTAKILGKEGMTAQDSNLMTRFVGAKVDNLADAVNQSDKLKEYANKNPKLFKIAKTLEGCPKSSGKHAAGVIISDEVFDSGSIPLRWDAKKKELITEWDGNTLDKLGFLKVDVLGLKTLDVLSSIQSDVNKRKE